MFEIVLYEPEIPPNTGNIARTCAVTFTKLHVIQPLGFELTDKSLKRSGMDYWQHVEWKVWPDWDTYYASVTEGKRMWFVESGGSKSYTDIQFQKGDILVFGKESKGLPIDLYQKNEDQWISIPMPNTQSRSLNLSNCVAIVLFEALRQHDFTIPGPI